MKAAPFFLRSASVAELSPLSVLSSLSVLSMLSVLSCINVAGLTPASLPFAAHMAVSVASARSEQALSAAELEKRAVQSRDGTVDADIEAARAIMAILITRNGRFVGKLERMSRC